MELLQTETSYLRNLNTIIQVCKNVLLKCNIYVLHFLIAGESMKFEIFIDLSKLIELFPAWRSYFGLFLI